MRAYHNTYKLPVVISNCSNNYGSHQYPEKLIPVCIYNIVDNKPLPIYGKGENIRDWLFVEDHARAIDTIFHQGKMVIPTTLGALTNGVYRFGEGNHQEVDKQLGRPEGASEKLITFVTDRAGHDLRYAIDATKLADYRIEKTEVTI